MSVPEGTPRPGGEVRRTRYIRDEKRTMYLRLDSTRSETITVHEADDCRRLSLSVAPGDEDRLDEVLGSSGLGHVIDDEHVAVNLAALRRRARRHATVADWDERWNAMVAYAGEKGWLLHSGASVRVHCVRTTTPNPDR